MQQINSGFSGFYYHLKWGLGKEFEIRRRIETIQTIVDEIGKNTEKSLEELRRLAVTQTPVEDYQLKLLWKICTEYETTSTTTTTNNNDDNQM